MEFTNIGIFMKAIIIAAVLACAALQGLSTVHAENPARPTTLPGFYEPSEGGFLIKQSGVGSRYHAFMDVYCLYFPGAGDLELMTRMYSGGGLNLTRAEYPEKTQASIVVSSIPAGWTPEAEMDRLFAIERNAESVYATDYHIQDITTEFGRTVGLRINDVIPGGPNGPFPLTRPIYRPAKEPIESMSVHRMFVRGSDRFEVAVYQPAPVPADGGTEERMLVHLTGLADRIVSSMYACTVVGLK